MAIVTSTSASTNILASWSQQDIDNLNEQNTITDAGYYQHNPQWASGTGTPVNALLAPITKVYHENRTLTAGGTYLYNMTLLPKTIFSGTYNIALTGVLALYVENVSTGWQLSSAGVPDGGWNVQIYATGISGMTGLFNGSGANLISPQSLFYIDNYLTGFPVQANRTTLFVVDKGSGCTINIGVLGI